MGQVYTLMGLRDETGFGKFVLCGASERVLWVKEELHEEAPLTSLGYDITWIILNHIMLGFA